MYHASQSTCRQYENVCLRYEDPGLCRKVLCSLVRMGALQADRTLALVALVTILLGGY